MPELNACNESINNPFLYFSLSIEFSPGRDGPVLFGDDKNGYALSYMFRLRDAQARGELRFYSFIIFMTDRVYLAACWSFLVRCVLSVRVRALVGEIAGVMYRNMKCMTGEEWKCI